MRPSPKDIKLKRAEGIVEILWLDGETSRWSVYDLRCSCRCAHCVDEMTGERTLNVAEVPDDIGISDMELVGSYAVKFTFSDGHDTGLYTWDKLYEAGQQFLA